MSECDRCGGADDDTGIYQNVEVEFLLGGRGLAHDERKVRASLCPQCFELVERAVTEVLCVRSVFGREAVDRPRVEAGARR